MFSVSEVSIRRRSLLPLTAGLAVAHTIAMLFVWQSNQRLFQSVQAMDAAGWLAIPAGPAADSLKNFGAAFWGGLFFTLSIGVGLSLLTWAMLYLWQQLFFGKKRWLWVPAGVWLILLTLVNVKGGVLFPTLLVAFTPAAAILAAIQFMPSKQPVKAHRLWPVPLATLALLTGLWATQLNAQLFVTIRDHLLLSNPIGMAVNDFYYRYTLYAAQAFKSFDQKEAPTCQINNAPDIGTRNRLAAVLARHDVLETPNGPRADLVVTFANGGLTLTSPRGDRLEVRKSPFLNDPGRWLRQFSKVGDRYAPFRRLTFFGLLLGFPILLYVLVDGIIGRVAGLFAGEPKLIWIRSAICLAVGLLLFSPIWTGRPVEVKKATMGAALTADTWPQRVAALGLIEKDKIEIADYPQYRRLLASNRVVERYYVARALAVSRGSRTYRDLLALIRDPHPNVVCQAYFALGERRDRRAIAAIQSQMVQSDHWYTQWYGYRAIKRLGWRQTQLKSIP